MVKPGAVSRQRRLPMVGAVGLVWVLAILLAGGLTFLVCELVLHTWAPWSLTSTHDRDQFLNVLKVSLGTSAGFGAAVALVVAYRRQAFLERDDAGHRQDEQARIARYAAAAQQLGDPQALVRVAGVYAMAHLADEWPEQRQQCIDVLCGYLRLPLTGPPDLEPGQTVPEPAERTGADEHNVPRTFTGREGEREVRETLLRLIAAHLQPDAPTSWSALTFRFTGATLPDLDFGNVRFDGVALFDGATFTGSAGFGRATFTGDAGFDAATFTGSALFNGATFTGSAGFDRATFTGSTLFNGATFTGGAQFYGATFTGGAVFIEATFTGDAVFIEATFTGSTAFYEATFTGGAVFNGATFTGGAQFYGATFAGLPPPEIQAFLNQQ